MVIVESSPDLVRIVNQKRAKRSADLLAKQAAVPVSKRPQVVDDLEGRREWTIRAIHLLRKIGYLTRHTFLHVAVR